MKKILYSTTLIATLLLMAGCSLDEKPLSKFDESESLKTPTLVYVNTVASLYNKLYDRFRGGDDNYNYMSEFTANVLFLPGRQGDWVDGGKHQNAFLHRWDPSTDYIKNLWNDAYSDIALCNASLETLAKVKQEGSVDADAITGYEAEVRAIRAFYYMWLTDFFGRIPIVTSSEMGVGDVQQAERSKAYEFVKKEICEIIPNLKAEPSQKTTSEYYARFTKAAGYAMLAKLAINGAVFSQDKWADGKFTGGIKAVEDRVTELGDKDMYSIDGRNLDAWETVVYCQEQIEALNYDLEAEFTTNFTNGGNDRSNENIFVRPMDDNVYRKYDTQVTRSLHYNHASTIGFSSWNGTAATIHALNAFDYKEEINKDDLSKSTFACADPRFAKSFFYGSCSVKNTTVKAGVSEDKWPYGYYIGRAAQNDYSTEDFSDKWGLYIVKWGGVRIKKYEFDPTTSDQNAFNADRTIFRYADILLLAAEAEYRMGVLGNAADLINRVRVRAGVEPIGEDDVNLEFILNERIRELIWETPGTRGDMVRCGIYTEPDEDKYQGVKHATSASDWVYDATGYTCVFPIPVDVISLNKNLSQNPGY